MSLPFPEMRQDIEAIASDWTTAVAILRRPATLDSAGRTVQAFATVGTDSLWIQPWVSRRGSAGGKRPPAGILEDVTHIGTQNYGGFTIRKDDRIAVSGQAFEYDVLAVDNWPTHSNVYLQLVKRNA